MVSAPLKEKKTDKDKVDTNGVGMAPYMISVSLMVVALSTNVIFAKSLTGRKFTSRFDWAKNKLLINGIITTMAAIALYIAIRFVGVEPNHPLEMCIRDSFDCLCYYNCFYLFRRFHF